MAAQFLQPGIMPRLVLDRNALYFCGGVCARGTAGLIGINSRTISIVAQPAILASHCSLGSLRIAASIPNQTLARCSGHSCQRKLLDWRLFWFLIRSLPVTTNPRRNIWQFVSLAFKPPWCVLFYFGPSLPRTFPALIEARLQQRRRAGFALHFPFNSINAVLSLIRDDSGRARAAERML